MISGRVEFGFMGGHPLGEMACNYRLGGSGNTSRAVALKFRIRGVSSSVRQASEMPTVALAGKSATDFHLMSLLSVRLMDGTRAIPRPASTRLMTVATWTASWAIRGVNPCV